MLCFALRKKYKLREFENWVLRRIFGCKKQEATGNEKTA
jgi:hypothetical protein